MVPNQRKSGLETFLKNKIFCKDLFNFFFYRDQNQNKPYLQGPIAYLNQYFIRIVFIRSQVNNSNPLLNGFDLSQTYVSMNVSSQLVTGFSSSQTIGPQSSTSEFLLPSPTNNMNFPLLGVVPNLKLKKFLMVIAGYLEMTKKINL